MTAATWKMIRRFSAGKMVVGLTLLSFLLSGIGMLCLHLDSKIANPIPVRIMPAAANQRNNAGNIAAASRFRNAGRGRGIMPSSRRVTLNGYLQWRGLEINRFPVATITKTTLAASPFQATKTFGFSALHCHGLATMWSGGIPAVPPSGVGLWSPNLLPIGWIFPFDFYAQGIVINPLDPPPR